jgi:hypothetical protein
MKEMWDDGVDPRVLFENEARDIISDVRSRVQCPNDGVGAGTSAPTVLYCPTVSMSGKVVYKSTLVNELNGNPFLSKDRLLVFAILFILIILRTT